ncbi:SH3 domain-containing protein [Streptomyces sp. NPDC057302]|uniref:SH3 domain-containing protein n=1 Tax=Streptomyces sp. NPDC057302 TaxID=3346094 RepID=UPI003629523F
MPKIRFALPAAAIAGLLTVAATPATADSGWGVSARAAKAPSVGSSACDWTWQWPLKEKATATVKLRTGPGTGYAARGVVGKGSKSREYCNKNWKWSYGKVLTGPNKGKKGWIASKYLTPTP